MITTSLKHRAIALSAALGLLALVPACKSQDPAILLSINGAYRIPQDVDTLIIAVKDSSNNMELVSHTFTLEAGQNFPFTVTLDDSGAEHSQLEIVATVTLSTVVSNGPVGEGTVEVDLKDGATVNATISLADQ